MVFGAKESNEFVAKATFSTASLFELVLTRLIRTTDFGIHCLWQCVLPLSVDKCPASYLLCHLKQYKCVQLL